MFWHPNKRIGLRLAVGALIVATGTSAALADVLVVRATGPSAKAFPAGKSLADNAKISLKPNDTLVLLDARGTRTLRGPGAFTPTSAPSAAPTVLAANTTQRRARIGAVRSVGMLSQRSPSIWYLDVSKSSSFCVAEPTNLTLWRADPSQAGTLIVTRARDGSSRNLDWATGQSTLSWPADFSINDGADYRLSWKSAANPATVRFKTLAKKPASLNDMAASLIQRGCQEQLDMLIETARLPEDNSTPAG